MTLETLELDKRHKDYGTWAPEIQERYDAGRIWLKEHLAAGNLYPKAEWQEALIDVTSDLLIHNYTGACPTLTFEVSPVQGCHIGCLYCLVTDGVHEQPLVLYKNYDQLLNTYLEAHHEKEHYYYFSAKTEAFQRPTLESGMAHKIIQVFIDHYKLHPNSKARLFIASKAGLEDLQVSHKGQTLLDLFGQLQGKMQFNTSISMMPESIQAVLEPHAAPMQQRLEAVRACQAIGIHANSALIQPIMPFMVTDAYIHDYFKQLKAYGIHNYKPEFLTACIENLALIGSLLGQDHPEAETRLYEAYFTKDNLTHVKQRSRMAPKKALSIDLLNRMKAITDPMGISMSICYWVRHALDITEETIPLINENGYQCLGYQRRLFEEVSQ